MLSFLYFASFRISNFFSGFLLDFLSIDFLIFDFFFRFSCFGFLVINFSFFALFFISYFYLSAFYIICFAYSILAIYCSTVFSVSNPSISGSLKTTSIAHTGTFGFWSSSFRNAKIVSNGGINSG